MANECLGRRAAHGTFCLVLGLLAAAAACGRNGGTSAMPPPGEGYVLSGRVVDPDHLVTPDAILMVGSGTGRSFWSRPVAFPGGSFATPPLPPGTYVVEVVRSPHSRTAPATTIGLTIVRLGNANQSGVTVRVEPDVTIDGVFRMESDNTAAPWPTSIVVNAFLALENDADAAYSTVAEGRPAGRFALHNVRGPRVLRCGYALAPGSRWWPSKVLLDGVDITNVPTDFSKTAGGRLEVVFTQHPARLGGVVRDGQGRPVPFAWVTLVSPDRALWHWWATTTEVVRADEKGGFATALAPGEYLLSAFDARAFRTRDDALEDPGRLAERAARISLGNRESKVMDVKTRAPQSRVTAHRPAPWAAM